MMIFGIKPKKDRRTAALEKAISTMPVSRYTGKPNRAALAKAISAIPGQKSLSPQAIRAWKIVPPERVLAVEEITKVSRHELRPDIYGPEPK